MLIQNVENLITKQHNELKNYTNGFLRMTRISCFFSTSYEVCVCAQTMVRVFGW